MSRHALGAAAFLALALGIDQAYGAGFGLLGRIADPEPGSYAQFGHAVAAVGSDLLIGAPNDEFDATELPGAVYLIDPQTHAVLRTFTRPGSPVHDLFGYAVAVIGGDVLIGAPGDPAQGIANGVVYRFDGASGTLEGQLLEPGPISGTTRREFGYALAVVDGNLLVGSGATDTAYLFDPTSGTLLRSFTSPHPWTGPLGRAVAAFGHDVLLGAASDQTPGQIGGAVYQFDGASGALLHVFFNPSGSDLDAFGTRVIAAGGDVFVGAPFNNAAGTNAGAVYQFDGASGTLRRTLLPSEYEYFGLALAVSDGGVLVGAQRGDAAFLFDPTSGTLLEDFGAPPSAFGGEFGAAIGTVGDAVAVAAPFERVGVAAAGAVYVFDRCGSGVVNQGEQCDDGNTLAGDGCSAECRLELCGSSPRSDCRKPAAAGGAKLALRHDTSDSRDQLSWTWKGTLAAAGELGDPTTDTSYLLCVYDAGASSQPVLALAARALDSCGSATCWRSNGSSGFIYRDHFGTPDGLTDVKLLPGHNTVVVKGKSPHLHLPAAALAPPLTVQLVHTGGNVCWDADFSALVVIGDKIRARSD